MSAVGGETQLEGPFEGLESIGIGLFSGPDSSLDRPCFGRYIQAP